MHIHFFIKLEEKKCFTIKVSQTDILFNDVTLIFSSQNERFL